MSILIKGLNLPKDGTYLDLVITEDGVVRCYGAEEERAAEAVELPEHGDLIDRDALWRAPFYPDYPDLRERIFSDPAIIPAERSESDARPEI